MYAGIPRPTVVANGATSPIRPPLNVIPVEAAAPEAEDEAAEKSPAQPGPHPKATESGKAPSREVEKVMSISFSRPQVEFRRFKQASVSSFLSCYEPWQ